MRYFSFLTLCLLAANGAQAAGDFAAITGEPDASLPFVRESVAQQINLVNNPEVQLSTEVFSLLHREGVRDATNIGITEENGSSTYFKIEEALRRVYPSRVVYSYLGPLDHRRLCEQMAAAQGSVFVLTVGADASSVDNRYPEACFARNILRVATLTENGQQLASISNWGPRAVRIAAVGMNVKVVGPGGREAQRSGGTLAAARVAGRLNAYALAHPELEGAALLDAFLRDETQTVPALFGKVEGARALR